MSERIEVVKGQNLPEGARCVTRLCSPELFRVRRRAMCTTIAFGSPKISIRCDIPEGELVCIVRILMLNYPLLRLGLRCFLGLHLLSGVVNFDDVTAVDGNEVHSLVKSHVWNLGFSQGRAYTSPGQ
jgi:hypothetical protein